MNGKMNNKVNSETNEAGVPTLHCESPDCMVKMDMVQRHVHEVYKCRNCHKSVTVVWNMDVFLLSENVRKLLENESEVKEE